MTLPFCNQIDLLTADVVVFSEPRVWDDSGEETTQRRVGATQCPKCELWWPIIEEPEEWVENETTGRCDAVSWWGGVVCEPCGLLMIVQSDGTPECYRLSWKSS